MIVVIDFETHYDASYSLKKLSTEEYVRDPRFEVIGVSIAVGSSPACWYTGDAVKTALDAVEWEQCSVLAFNTAFDGAILAWRYGKYPALWLDAMGMARCCGVSYNGGSLGKVCTTLGVGTKGDYVGKMSGKRAKDFTPSELAEYGEYCINDNHCAREIYKALIPRFPLQEVLVQDRMLRMFIEPVLQFDQPTLQAHYQDTVEAKRKGMQEVAKLLSVDYDEAVVKKTLMSNPKFAEVLRGLGIEPPTKLSAKTGKETYAFAKTDPEFMELLEDDDSTVQAVVAARLGTKSTIEETRASKFISLGRRGAWPVQYTYWGAGARFSGSGGVNPQNLRRGGRLRDSVIPPVGHALVAADLRQIECRMTNYVAGQNDVVEAFRLNDQGIGEDVYCIAARRIFGCTVLPDDKPRRMPGKISELSLGYGGSDKAYKKMLFAQAKMHVTEAEAKHVVAVYRNSHPHVKKLWYSADDALDAMCRGLTFSLGRFGCLDGSHPDEGVGLPGGTFVRLPELQKVMTETGERKFLYSHWEKYKKVRKEIYGAKLVAMCMQGLARIVMTDAMMRIATRYPARFMTHDELVWAIVLAEVEQAKEFIHQEMTRILPWAPDLPLACEVGSGPTYGSAK